VSVLRTRRNADKADVPTTADAVTMACACLRGEAVALSAEVVTAAREHRVELLIAERDVSAVPDLRADLRKAAILDALRESELRRLLEAFAAAGIDVLLLKGAALAYTLYPAPHLRPRADVDLLIAPERLDEVDRLLATQGWRRDVEPEFAEGAGQRHYHGPRGAAIVEHLDLHWKIANPRVFGEAFAFEELSGRAIPVPRLGAHARTLSLADALLLACIHRVAHHDDAVDLLWIWDIHLLASALTAADAAAFVDRAARKAMRSVCARGLALAADRFHTPRAAALAAELERGALTAEPTARFIGGGLRLVDIVRADLAVTPAWRARVALVREHLFPSRAYMRSSYARCPEALLPLAYAHRILSGAPKWFRRP